MFLKLKITYDYLKNPTDDTNNKQDDHLEDPTDDTNNKQDDHLEDPNGGTNNKQDDHLEDPNGGTNNKQDDLGKQDNMVDETVENNEHVGVRVRINF